jgi:hypothetical protein
MNIDDSQGSMLGNMGNRMMGQPKYPEKMPNYSPSTSYNYGHQGGYNGMQQHPRRRADRFKRESINQSDRLVKQNDLIIRLLKEIRDRLPPPPYQEQRPAQTSDSAGGIPDGAQDTPVFPAGNDTASEASEETHDFEEPETDGR